MGGDFFSFRHRVQTGSGAHPATCSARTGGCFLGGKVAGSWRYLLTSSLCRR